MLANENHNSNEEKNVLASLFPCLYVSKKFLACASAAGSPNSSSSVSWNSSQVGQLSPSSSSVDSMYSCCWLLAHNRTEFDPVMYDKANVTLTLSVGNCSGLPIM
jgi:hypothetical protein